MLALCLMFLGTHYAQNYAGIIGWSLGVIASSISAPREKDTESDNAPARKTGSGYARLVATRGPTPL